MSEYLNDYHALKILRARGILEVRNGILIGHWEDLDSYARETVAYLCDEWDFCWVEKEKTDGTS